MLPMSYGIGGLWNRQRSSHEMAPSSAQLDLIDWGPRDNQPAQIQYDIGNMQHDK